MTLFDYIAAKSPAEAWHLLSEADHYLERPESEGEMSSLLRQYVDQGGEGALMRLAEIHPDKQLIQYAVVGEKEEFTNASGGSCGCGNNNNFQGPPMMNPYTNFYGAAGPQKEGNEDKLITLLIGGSLMLLVTTFALKQL
jgi:hypothetical protein